MARTQYKYLSIWITSTEYLSWSQSHQPMVSTFRNPAGLVPRSLCQAPNIPKLCSWWIGSCPTMPEISSNDSTCPPEGRDFGRICSEDQFKAKENTATNIWLYWNSTETLLNLLWKFHSILHRSFRHLCLAFSSLKTSSFSMSSARRASWDIIWSDCWHRLHLPWRNGPKIGKEGRWGWSNMVSKSQQFSNI